MLLNILSLIVGISFSLILLLVLIKKPSLLLFFFLFFYLISIYHCSGTVISRWLISRMEGEGLQPYWKVGLFISRLRFIFLVLFVHAFHRFRGTTLLTVFMTLFIAAASFLPFFIYSIIPNIMEIVVLVYSFLYWLLLYLLRDCLSISNRRQALLRSMLFCSSLFLLGIILDMLEKIPQTRTYFSLLLIDFYPFYIIVVGAVMVAWSLGNLYGKVNRETSVNTEHSGLEGLSITRREKEIVSLILHGETNTSIAEALFISESTVKKHVNNIFRKLGIRSRWELLKLTKNTPEEVLLSSQIKKN